MCQSVVVRLADQHYVRGGLGEKLAPFQQAFMSIKRIVSPTLNREYGSGKFLRTGSTDEPSRRGAGFDIDKQAAQGVAQEIIDSGLDSVQVHLGAGVHTPSSRSRPA